MTLNQQIQYIKDRLSNCPDKSSNADYLKAILKSLEELKDRFLNGGKTE